MLKTLALMIASVCFAWTARSQSNTNGLQVSAQAFLLVETNHPKIFLTLHLVNSSDHEVTVLTKNLNLGIQPASDKLMLSIGYENGAVTYQGHPIIPSLYDFSPVTLRPNEEALIRREITDGLDVLGKRNDMPLTVGYSVSSEWGKLFGVWSGTVQMLPFTAVVRK